MNESRISSPAGTDYISYIYIYILTLKITIIYRADLHCAMPHRALLVATRGVFGVRASPSGSPSSVNCAKTHTAYRVQHTRCARAAAETIAWIRVCGCVVLNSSL